MPKVAIIVATAAVSVALTLAVGCNRPSGRDTPAGSPGGGSAVSQQQLNATTNDRLTLPGWEDLLVGDVLPADARQSCTDKDPTDGITQLPDHEKICKGCRSAQLPTPCVEVMSFDDGEHAEVIIAKLPTDDDRQAAKIVDALHVRWGAATSRDNKESWWQQETWEAQPDRAVLVTNYSDLHPCSVTEIENHASSTVVSGVSICAHQPSERPMGRVVTISKQTHAAPGGTAIIGYDDYKNKSLALAAKLVAVFKKDANDCDAIANDVTAITSDPDFIGVNAYQKAHDADRKKFDTESAVIEKDFIAAATPVVTKCKDNKNAWAAFEKMQ